MSTTGTVGGPVAPARGVLALAVTLGAARLPERLAGWGVTLAARIAPPEPVEEPAVVVPVQRGHHGLPRAGTPSLTS